MLRHLTFANVTSALALFIALGGTTYAVARNEIKSRNIAPGAVKRADIGRNAVNSAKVANGSLRPIDFAAGALTAGPAGPQGPPGAQGAPGAKGDKGDPGDDGAPGATNVVARLDPTLATAPADGSENSTASCEDGEVAIAGGVDQQGGVIDDMQLAESVPVDSDLDGQFDGWTVVVFNSDHNNDAAGGIEFGAVVMCASP